MCLGPCLTFVRLELVLNVSCIKEVVFEYTLSILSQWLHRVTQNGWIQIQQSADFAEWSSESRALLNQVSHNLCSGKRTEPQWHGMTYEDFWNQILQLSNDPLYARWISLKKQLNLSHEEISALVLLVTIQFDQHVLRVLRLAMAEASPNLPRWGFIIRMLAADEEHVRSFADLFNPDKTILFRECILRLVPPSYSNLAEAMIYVDKRVADYLYGIDIGCRDFYPAVDLNGFDVQIRSQIERMKSRSDDMHFSIHGSKGSGRLHVCRGLADSLKYDGIWALDLSMSLSYDDAMMRVQHARAMATLHHAMIVVTAIPKAMERWDEAMHIVSCKLHESIQPVVWILSGDTPYWLEIAPDRHIHIPMPTRSQREDYWISAIPRTLSVKWIQQLAGQFILTKGQIDDAIRSVDSYDSLDDETYYQRLSACSRALSQEGLGRLAVPEPARVSFDQLIVSNECETALKDLLMYARHRKELAKNWGFDRSMAYGLGLSALFSGPPGTGKTFAAQVVATELQLELYRVDLSQIVSKYVGETEKHLSELFNAAEQGDIMLLFDEADSIFGKRTDVKSSVDRYANLEINYLLQRLERFAGVSILTSNFDSAIDEAFMRRIRFKVPFDLPDERARFVLWKKFLSSSIPRSDDVNLNSMAEVFELSGGHIKEAVLRAASIAYGSTPKLVTQDLLIRSAQLEYKKIGKLAPKLSTNDRYDTHARWK